MSYLLDTNVISEMRKARPADQVRQWFANIPDMDIYLSVLTLGEIRHGVEAVRPTNPGLSQQIEDWLINLRAIYRQRILLVTEEISDRWGHFLAIEPRHGTDALLAATAHVAGLTLVTRNIRHFENFPIQLFNPWQG